MVNRSRPLVHGVPESNPEGGDRRPPRYLGEVFGEALRDATESRLLALVKEGPVPQHLAIIMDGNRRFAREHGLLITEGHRSGKDTLEELLDWCLEVGIHYLTVYALSTENFRRSESELGALMDLFDQSFRELARDERVHRHGIQVRVIGDRSALPEKVRDAIRLAERATEGYQNYFFTLAIAYGGREEIVDAIRSLARRVRDGELEPEAIDAGLVARSLYTTGLPDPDFVFRTSGEERISNFLLWQSAYSELYFADALWPGLTKLDFLRALHTFQTRQRRFGT